MKTTRCIDCDGEGTLETERACPDPIRGGELVGVVVAVVALVGGFEGGFEGGLGLEESVVVGLLVVEDASDGVSGGATVAMLSAPPSTMASGRRAAMASELRFNQSVSLASSTFVSFASLLIISTNEINKFLFGINNDGVAILFE